MDVRVPFAPDAEEVIAFVNMLLLAIVVQRYALWPPELATGPTDASGNWCSECGLCCWCERCRARCDALEGAHRCSGCQCRRFGMIGWCTVDVCTVRLRE